MGRSFVCLVICLLALSCSQSQLASDQADAALVKSQKVAAVDCNDEDFCTREYLPTICQFNGQSFDASNPCEAKKMAKRFACEKNLQYVDDAVSCQGKPEKPLAVTKDCATRSLCTKEMNPHSCTFNGEKFLGNNRCEALQKVRAFACERRLELNDSKLSCQPIKAAREHAR
jgi:hypothetical protein